MSEQKKNKLLEAAYLVCFALYFICSLTVFSPIGDRLLRFTTRKFMFGAINWSAVAVLAVIYIFKKHESKKEVAAEILVAALFTIVTFTNQTVSSMFQLTQWTMFFTTGFFIICATVTTFKRIAATTLATSLFMFAVMNFTNISGLIPEFTLDRFGTIAHYMGYYYYSHPSYYMLFAWVIYMYLRGEKKIGWIELAAEFSAQYLLYKHTTCRLGFVCACIVLLLYIIFIKLDLINLNWKIVKFASAVGFSAAAVFTLACGYLYSFNIGVLGKINGVLSGRLNYINMAFDRYNINLFGRLILPPESGSYFYLDSAYAYSLFGCGLIFFIVVLAMHSYISYYACKTNNKYLLIWAITLMIFGIIGDAWVSITYSPFILGFFIMLRDRKHISGTKSAPIYGNASKNNIE